MNSLGPFGLLVIAVVIAALFVLVGAIPILLGRNLITGQPAWTHVKEWLLYTLIAALIIAAFAGSFFYATSKGIDERTTVKWMNIILAAVFVFGFAVKKFWRFRKRRAFWVELGGLLVAHFVILQRLRWQQANYFWLMIVFGIPEMFVVFFLVSLKFNPEAGPPAE
jgi:hypothetical protein